MQIVRIKKMSGAGTLLFAALFIFSQTSHVGSTDVTYWAEVMIEGNKTLDVSVQLPGLIGTVLDTGVTITNAEIAAECEIVGQNTTCWCGPNYVWSNLVCDSVNKCCNVEQCVANISFYTPLCLPVVNVSLIGTLTGSSVTVYNMVVTIGLHCMIDKQEWYDLKISKLKTTAETKTYILDALGLLNAFNVLNAFNSLTIQASTYTGLNTYSHNFTVSLSSVFATSKVQGIISTLLSNPVIYTLNVKSLGMVYIEAPTGKVCYNSRQQLNCTCIEAMSKCVWQMSRDEDDTFILGPGSQVMLGDSCTETSTVTLLKTNGYWSGSYSCLFVTANIAHMAIAPIQIALLPEAINLTSNPQNIDCTEVSSTKVTIICSIDNSTEPYTTQINLGNSESSTITKDESNGLIKYTTDFPINCQADSKPASLIAGCTFVNSLNQLRNTSISVPIIYPTDLFCAEDVIVDRVWPKTKNNETAVIDCTTLGRQGTLKRKCNGDVWGDEVSLCVKAVLNNVALQATDFEKGLGATQAGAQYIFQSLKNNTSEEENTFGDVQTTVAVFQTMTSASVYIPLGENLLGDFIDSASSMLNVSWVGEDEEESSTLASQYLSSVENLMKSIRINTSDGYNATYIQLQVCRTRTCNKTVFNVEVELNATADIAKTVGIQSLANRLPKLGYENALFPSIVVSSTVENNTQPTVSIRLAFPNDEGSSASMYCVFWNVTEQRWSDEGCEYVQGPGNIAYCECKHLTSFSMLMSKTSVSMPFLDQITYLGLGISICSLIIYILIECLVWTAVVKSNLSHFRHTALLNIAISLLLADCSFLASSFPSILTDSLCLVLVVAKHYFFLAMFFWMLCLSLMLVHQLIFVFSRIGKKTYMILGFTIGYFFPTVTVGVTYIYYDKATDIPYYSPKTCWLTYQSTLQGSIYAFLFPVGTIVMINMLSMFVVIATVLKPSGAETNKKGDKDAAKSIIKVIIFLTPIFGGTWILGLFVFLMDDYTQIITYIVQYAFTIVNSLQGFFILLTGCFAEKRVRDEILRIILGKSANNAGSTTVTK